MKKCSTCKIEKEFIEFSKKSSTKDGLRNICKSCSSIMNKNYRKNNRDKIKEQKKEYYVNYSDKIKEQQKEYQNKKYKSDTFYKLICILRVKWRMFRKGKNHNFENILGKSYSEYLDYVRDNSIKFLGPANDHSKFSDKDYMESHFDIDHIIPISSAKNKDELIELFHYSNIQIISAYENRCIKRNNQ